VAPFEAAAHLLGGPAFLVEGASFGRNWTLGLFPGEYRLMSLPNEASMIRPLVRRVQPYVPGEQPKIKGLIKLNTNENPYPPSPKVLTAVKAAVDARLRLYPNPTAQPLREKLARLHGAEPENIIVGNGLDELLAMAVRAFVEPKPSQEFRIARRRRATVQYFTPSYSLYPVLAELHGARTNPVPLNPDFSLPSLRELKRARQWDFAAALSFVTTPNAPSGRGYSTADLEKLCRVHKGVIILDEAYADFAPENAMALALQYPHVLVARTFSKAYSLCFQRVGYFVGPHALVGALQKIRDSYNVNGLGQVAALATLEDLPYYRDKIRKIIDTRQFLGRALEGLGFQVFPSQTNFILARPPRLPAKDWMEGLRQRKVLVRWFDSPEAREYLRISIGTSAEANALVEAARQILPSLAD
jgi:histidinol-phosphate aminotransferase